MDNSEAIQHLLDQALALHQNGNLIEAQILYKKIIAQQNTHADALYLLGTTFLQQGDYLQSIHFIESAIRINPNVADFYINIADAFHHLERHDESVAHLQKAIALDANNQDAHFNLGNIYLLQNKLEEAIVEYRKVLSLNPEHEGAQLNLGFCLLKLEQYQEAATVYKQIIATNQASSTVYYYFGRVLHKLNRYDEAITAYQQALSLDSSNSKIYFNLGNSYNEIKKFKEAIRCYEKAYAIQPNNAVLLTNWGNALFSLHNFEGAIKLYNQALECDSQNTTTLFNRALTFSALRKPNDAIRDLQTIIASHPDHGMAHFQIAWCYLLFCRFHEGWKKFESRLTFIESSFQPECITGQMWLGENLAGKTLLLWSEGSEHSGLGDTIHFIRYVKLVVELGAKVYVLAQSSLVPLFNHLPEIEKAFDTNEIFPTYDYHCPIMSLPHRFDTDLTTIPSQVPYLFCNADKKYKWQKLLTGTRYKIGVVWRGTHTFGRSAQRYIALRDLLSIFDQRVLLVILQIDISADEKELLSTYNNVFYANDAINDFDDTAALIDCLDLVISIDTSVAHLTGALGKPLWLLLQELSDWRWLLDRNDSPWYPTARLFRQKIDSDWSNVINELKTALKNI